MTEPTIIETDTQSHIIINDDQKNLKTKNKNYINSLNRRNNIITKNNILNVIKPDNNKISIYPIS